MEQETKITHKVCSQCKDDKNITEFYYDNTNKRYRASCKNCHNAVILKHYRSLSFEERSRRNTKMCRKQDAKFLETYGVTYSHMHYENRKLHTGPRVCSVCGSTDNVHLHIPDYNNYTVVIQLCKKHHHELHSQLRRDLEDA